MISREYGQQLEFTGDYPSALAHYERGLLKTGTAGEMVLEGPSGLGSGEGSEDDSLTAEQEHNNACKAGIARYNLDIIMI